MVATYSQIITSSIYNDGSDDYLIIQNPVTKKVVICGPIGSSNPLTEQELGVYPTGELEFNEVSTGQTPVTGKMSLYFKTDEKLYKKNPSGVETEITSGSSGGDVTGPASAVAGNFASFNGTSGKIIQDSGSKASDFASSSHKTTHQDGGSDEISVAGLSGVLADAQIPQAHDKNSHNGAVMSGTTGMPENLGANYMDIDAITTPSNPGVGIRRMFVDSTDGELKVRTNAGTSVSLEGGGGGSVPTGTGFRHVTAGVEDAVAQLVFNLDVDATAQIDESKLKFDNVTGHDHNGTNSKKVSHTDLENAGSNSHSTIDTHLGSSSNPHTVTANQVLPSQAGNDGKYLKTDGTDSSWAAMAGTPWDGTRAVTIAVFLATDTVLVGDGEVGLSVPFALAGYNLIDVIGVVNTLGGSSGSTDIQIRRRRNGVEVDMLSTKVTIAYNEYYARDEVIDTSNDDVTTGDMIYIDIDDVSGTAPKGLSVSLTFQEP